MANILALGLNIGQKSFTTRQLRKVSLGSGNPSRKVEDGKGEWGRGPV